MRAAGPPGFFFFTCAVPAAGRRLLSAVESALLSGGRPKPAGSARVFSLMRPRLLLVFSPFLPSRVAARRFFFPSEVAGRLAVPPFLEGHRD